MKPLTPEREMASLVEHVAEKIRAHLIPSVAVQIPWAQMDMGQDGYRRAAEAVVEMLIAVAKSEPERAPWE